MKNRTYTNRVLLTCAGSLLASLVYAEGEIAISNSPRTTITVDTSYIVETLKVDSDYPIATRPQFSFDCTQTNGWVIDAQNRVSKVTDLGGSTRYVTSVIDEINHSNYKVGTIDLWYSGWTKINAPTLMPADSMIKGPYLDFGRPGSFSCLFFDPSVIVDGVAWNKLTNVGTVVGVYKPYTGSCANYPDYGEAIAAGQLLGGRDFFRESGYDVTTYGIHDCERMFFRHASNSSRSCKAVQTGGTVWMDRQKHDVGMVYWRSGWQVVAFNPSNATTLETHGIGVGDCNSCDYSRTCGGQAIAELLIFDSVLSETDVEKLIAYLSKKWLSKEHSGEDGVGRMAALNISDGLSSPGSGVAATVNVPVDETLTIDQVRGGRAKSTLALPSIVKNGAGSLIINDAADFGGEVKLQAGTLAFTAKAVPTFEHLPAGMTLHLDPSDTSTLKVEDGRVADWTNLLWSARQISLYNNTVERRPRFVANALGEGLNLLDFGCRSEDTYAFLNVRAVPRCTTVFAVVDARVQGGGQLMDEIPKKVDWGTRVTPFTGAFFKVAQTRANSSIWVNGRQDDIESEGYEVPAIQVLAVRMPTPLNGPYRIGARTDTDAGGFRLGEFIAYERALTEDEIRDVTAYLMKKWLNRSAPGYENVSGTDVADLQRVVASADTVIHVPAGVTKTIAKLMTSGAVVKTGAGRLLIGQESDITGGLVVSAGSVGLSPGATIAADCTPAKDPILHFDATKAASYYTWEHDGTNFVAAWQTMGGRSGAYTQESAYNRIPFLNTWDTLNGHPVIDFGKQVDGYSNSDGAYMRVEPEVRNLRAAYVVYGSQAKGGQIFGSRVGTTYDMGRLNYAPTIDSALFGNSCYDLQQGEVYTNGVKIAADQNHRFSPTGGYQLIEIHPAAGLRFNALATSGTPAYLHGGCRMGEVIVYERPLSEREKIATRNYLLQKWFPDMPRGTLPAEPPIQPIAGDFGVTADGTWDIAVKPDGTADVLAITGTMSFGIGAAINLQGLAQMGELRGRKIVLAKAGAYVGLSNLMVTGDVALTGDNSPILAVGADGKLVVQFGSFGFTIHMR